ncbi:MAG: hypothetical protein MJZ05_11165 [Fibrobacter sp.]|nr:hypothetical protein [Fibrobacter sp.]
MNLKSLFGLCAAFALCACNDSDVTVSYDLKAPVDVEICVQSFIATYDMEGEERMGTITKTFGVLNYSKAGDTIKVNRKYSIDASQGYLKNFMPSELAWRVEEVNMSAVDRNVLSIEGLNEGYDSLVNKIPMPKRWRDQLLNPDYKPHLARAEKHRWEMDHLIKGTVPERADITQLLKDQGRLNFALIQVDSVVTKGFQHLDKRNCLWYNVYLHEKESFPYYIWEQHVNSKIIPEKYMAYNTGLSAEYSTEFGIAIDVDSGIPCQEREVKKGVHTMVNPTTKDTVTFNSHILLERLFTVKKPGENEE